MSILYDPWAQPIVFRIRYGSIIQSCQNTHLSLRTTEQKRSSLTGCFFSTLLGSDIDIKSIWAKIAANTSTNVEYLILRLRWRPVHKESSNDKFKSPTSGEQGNQTKNKGAKFGGGNC